jgi:5'-3' exonuclease
MKLVLVDADFIPYTVCHVKKDNPEKTLEECKQLSDEYFNSLMIATEATHYIACFTVGKCFRYDIYPEYKANRKKLVPIKWCREVKDYLIDRYNGWWNNYDIKNTHEADDLIGIARSKYSDAIVISPDKDLLYNLPGINYNPKNGKFIRCTEDFADLNFWTSMITGDAADNIKGVPGKGEKFAEKLFLNIDDKESLRNIVFEEYINYFEEVTGIEEFYKNYKCLYIVRKGEVNIPEPIEYQVIVNEFKKKVDFR